MRIGLLLWGAALPSGLSSGITGLKDQTLEVSQSQLEALYSNLTAKADQAVALERKASLRVRPKEPVDAVNSYVEDIKETSAVLAGIQSEIDADVAPPATMELVHSSLEKIHLLDQNVQEILSFLKQSDVASSPSKRRLDESKAGVSGKKASRSDSRDIWEKQRRLFKGTQGGIPGRARAERLPIGHRNLHVSGQSHLHRQLFDLHDAILTGNHKPLRSFLENVNQRYAAHLSSQTRPEGRRRLTKPELCQTLATCASRMSLYDLFVYMFSDDIDPGTGSLDDNIVRLGQGNILLKKEAIGKLASAILDGDESQCDGLLQQFHRTVEFADVPKWEGATVAQVCVAEGTTTYVKLDEAAAASYHLGASEAAMPSSVFYSQIAETFEGLAKAFAQEPVLCAEHVAFPHLQSWQVKIELDYTSQGRPDAQLELFDDLGRSMGIYQFSDEHQALVSGATYFLRVSDADIYLHIYGGALDGNPAVLHGDEAYTKWDRCGGPCANSAFVIEAEPSKENAYYIRVSESNLYLHIDGSKQAIVHGSESYVKTGCGGGPCPSSLFILEREPTKLNAYYIRASDADLYLHIYGGSINGNKAQLHGDEAYTKWRRCNGPCGNSLFVFEPIHYPLYAPSFRTSTSVAGLRVSVENKDVEIMDLEVKVDGLSQQTWSTSNPGTMARKSDVHFNTVSVDIPDSEWTVKLFLSAHKAAGTKDMVTAVFLDDRGHEIGAQNHSASMVPGEIVAFNISTWHNITSTRFKILGGDALLVDMAHLYQNGILQQSWGASPFCLSTLEGATSTFNGTGIGECLASASIPVLDNLEQISLSESDAIQSNPGTFFSLTEPSPAEEVDWTVKVLVSSRQSSGSRDTVRFSFMDESDQKVGELDYTQDIGDGEQIVASVTTSSHINSVRLEMLGHDALVFDEVQLYRQGAIQESWRPSHPQCLSTDPTDSSHFGGKCLASRTHHNQRIVTTAALEMWHIKVHVADDEHAGSHNDFRVVFADSSHKLIGETVLQGVTTRNVNVDLESGSARTSGVASVAIEASGDNALVIDKVQVFKNGVEQLQESGWWCLSGEAEDTTPDYACATEATFTLVPLENVEQFVFGLGGRNPNGIAQKYRFPTGLDMDPTVRDVYGRPLGGSTPAFTYVSYTQLLWSYSKCEESYRDDTLVRNGEITEADHRKYYVGNLTKECIPSFFEPIQTGLDLVFGAKASIGFVCGTKDAIVRDGKSMPGRCCLDAPFQLDKEWGQSYDCSLECQYPGSIFAGMNSDACDAVGGTWCPNPTDCQELVGCIEEYKVWSLEQNETAFFHYLNATPGVTDSTDPDECGKAREYFGFAGSFVNDRKICGDIEQLRYSNDFLFLDEMFGQGEDDASSTEPPPEIDAPPPVEGVDAEPVPPLELNEIDRTASSAGPVQNVVAWHSTNFAFKQVKGSIKAAPCPSLPFVGSFPCKVIQFVITKILYIIAKTYDKIYDISEFTRMKVATIGDVRPIVAYEDTTAVYANMGLTGKWLEERFTKLNEYLNDEVGVLEQSFVNQNNYLNAEFGVVAQHMDILKAHVSNKVTEMKEHMDQVKEHMGLQLESKFDELNDQLQQIAAANHNETRRLAGPAPAMIAATADASLHAGIRELDVQVNTVKKTPKTLVCLVTSEGRSINPDVLEVTGYYAEEMVEAVVPNIRVKELSVGKLHIEIPEEETGTAANTYFLKAAMTDGQGAVAAERSLIVSFE